MSRCYGSLLALSLVAIRCGGQVTSSEADGGASTGERSGGSSGNEGAGSEDGASIQSDSSSSKEAGHVASSSSSGSPGAGSSGGSTLDSGVDVTLPPGCTVSPSACGLCLGGPCCGQVVECKLEAACLDVLACVIACEQAGSSGVTCWNGPCARPSNATATALFVCGTQQCGTECGP